MDAEVELGALFGFFLGGATVAVKGLHGAHAELGGFGIILWQ